MLKALITYLNLKLDLLNYFDLTRCLVELKDDSEGTKQPVEYISNGNYDVIDWDEFNGVSYWRLRDEITSERTDSRKYKAGARNNIETTIPLKLVFAVPREKLTEDDAYSFDRIRQTMVKQFAIDDDVIKTTLEAESVRINVASSNSDAKEVWEEETEGTGTFEPKYETVFGSIDVDIVIISKHSCLPTECEDVESDIIRAFNWCGNTAVTIGRLTQAQQDCISDFLCGSPDPVQIQVNGVNTDTAASGTTYDQEIENTDGTAVGTAANPSVVGDVQIQVNGVNTDTAPAETTYNQQILNLNGDVMGNEANPSIIGNSTVTINGSSLGATGSVLAEGSVNIPVNLDGSPAGSWDGDSWEVTSAPCADATVQLNGVDMTDIASGDTENIEVRQETGATLVGSKQGQYWRIDDTTIRNQANDWSDTEGAEGTYTLGLQRVVDSDGSNIDTVDYKPIADGPVFTCTPADYGTRILSVFRREFCITSIFGFGLSYLDDEYATGGHPVINVRRSSDSATADFTPTEITDGTLTTWVGVGNDGYVVKYYDHTLNGFSLYNTNASYQGYIVKSGSLVVDSQGNPTVELRSTQGYILGSDAHNTGYMPFWNTNSTCWVVQKLATGASQAWLLTNSGNPAIARVGSGSFPNSRNSGSPITKVNDTVLADQNWDTLMTATENIEVIMNTIDIDFSLRTNWSQSATIKVVLNYPVGSFLSEFVVTFRDGSSQQDYIFDDRNAYYGYY